jgi:hypothetical protein
VNAPLASVVATGVDVADDRDRLLLLLEGDLVLLAGGLGDVAHVVALGLDVDVVRRLVVVADGELLADHHAEHVRSVDAALLGHGQALGGRVLGLELHLLVRPLDGEDEHVREPAALADLEALVDVAAVPGALAEVVPGDGQLLGLGRIALQLDGARDRALAGRGVVGGLALLVAVVLLGGVRLAAGVARLLVVATAGRQAHEGQAHHQRVHQTAHCDLSSGERDGSRRGGRCGPDVLRITTPGADERDIMSVDDADSRKVP